MLKWWFQTQYDRLIEAIRTKNIEEAQRLIAEMSITELNKVDSKGETVLTWAA
ncbi:hypothetical protein RFEPED_0762 [Rickettsia felis str. Pedreira]|uniref:Uncharacterized protein n=1 Tax=Rickettsia felis str. Pedreira TaxID=1359196 RepID=A0A0F3MRY0_RICFI|nr:hypothetical protein [Rickettsia felis]KJV58192.1 hypothetical protein RFEPED_0567 [Rickettsia felis str. Pedreira]KJV58381.1 hypothetical protein RFEPED_0762 [Rickettsia felis str. Pedreira]MDE8611852.1 hypothetical protein [Rickettsia felis]